MKFNTLFPELIVKDLDRSIYFYVELIGLNIEYSRPEERFHFLSFGGAQLMLLEDNDNEHAQTGPMDYPRGQGINFSIAVPDVFTIASVREANEYPIRIPVRDQWHRQNKIEHGHILHYSGTKRHD